MSWLYTFGYDLAAFLFSLALIAAYYVYLGRRLRRDPTYTIQGLNNLARSLWVIHAMSTPGKDVMAVQTLRNFVMGASLMASTAALLIIGTLTLSGQAENIAKSWHVLNLVSSHSAEIWIIKVLCLLIDFIVAFFAFAMSVRLANQVVFMINVPDTGAHLSLSPHAVGQRLNRAGSLFSVGLRTFFFAVPLVFWLFGPVFLVVASAWLVFAFYRLDRGDLADQG
ncbi:DUF599 domain-containing protein [Parasulfuritortus cantonensis]|uniref:DUF599 domain-containing protein n=1 Tax=Parasulfuritortus cantonensis TaxID=2528202 RepID=A0A4R1B195_9PROT|nr:DUF599 domain-containing protein [Parasulfuritortus cantonensis]TCJ11541.1 DUF599 domain-containing protein [Parasulfuritortus cantonensis]